MWVFRTMTYGGYAVLKDGTANRRKRAAQNRARRTVFCFGLSEPDAGSDAASLTTQAKAIEADLLSTARRFSPRAWISAIIACW